MIKEKNLKFLLEFHSNGNLPKGSNSSFISPITKVENLIWFRGI